MQKQDGRKGTQVVDGGLVKNSGCLRVFQGTFGVISGWTWTDSL